jgi:hypothetical protein
MNCALNSGNLLTWSVGLGQLTLDHPSHPGNVMLTFDVIDSYVYIFGTGGLARDKPIWMWRNPVSDFPLGYWEPWGYNGNWGWGIPNENTPVLDGSYGELSFRSIGGKSVLSFFNAGAYKCTAIVVDTPWSNWYTGNSVDYAKGSTTPQLYGGYISPESELGTTNGMKFIVSQWITSVNDPYKAMLFSDTLHAGL